MTYELRRSPELTFRCFAPKPPNDITPDQVREYLAGHPEVKVVWLSGGWMKRPKAVQDEWRKLDDDLWEAGIDVYFTPGGICTWEAGFSDGKAPGPPTGRGPITQSMAATAPLDGVIPSPVRFSPPGSEPDEVLHPHGNAVPCPCDSGEPCAACVAGDGPRHSLVCDEGCNGSGYVVGPPTVPTDLGNQVVMSDPDGEPLIDIAGPEDAAPDQLEHAAVPARSGPVGGVTDQAAADGQPEPVLQQDAGLVEQRIREVAAQPGIGGYRKIAAALLANHGIDVSHMKVKRVLAKTPAGVS